MPAARPTPRVTTLDTKGTSFSRGTAPARRRLILALDGMEKQGKTHLALTAPRPTAILNFDIGLEGVVEKASSQDQIYPANYPAPRVLANQVQQTSDAAQAVWTKVATDYYWALKNCRSLICDTASEMWETLRLARFGKLTQVMPHHYGPVNAEFRALIRAAYDHDCNVVFLHKLKAVYDTKMVNGKEVSNKILGAFARQGMGDMGFLAQLNGMVWRGDPDNPPVSKGDYYTNVTYDPTGTFNLFVKDCRQNAALSGETIPQHLLDFATVAQMVVEDSVESDWT